jgi:glucose/arabinose dehydrogenase
MSKAACIYALAALLLSACHVGPTSRGPEQSPAETLGPNPTLPKPDKKTIPTVQVAEAQGWPVGMKPTSPAGAVRVQAFATGLTHPRWLYALPNGDVLVAETNAPNNRPEDGKGIKGKVVRKMQAKAGAAVPSPDRITLLRDANGDGVAETRTEFISGLHSPFGMALIGSDLYVANTDAILKFRYTAGVTHIAGAGAKVADLPAGDINHHWTKNIIASKDGTRLYATVGSNSNVAENGMPAEEGRAAIWEFDLETGDKRIYATGIRNGNGMAWEPQNDALWIVANERDELGDDLVPDYLTSVTQGAFYGWPYSYFGQHVDKRVEPQRPDLVSRAIPPDYALGAHVAALGLAWGSDTALPFHDGMFIGEHGSWNRSVPAGYKVVFVPFKDGKPVGLPVDVLTGFVSGAGQAFGRPVGVTFDNRGALLVADDVGNTVWRASTPGKEARKVAATEPAASAPAADR